MALSLTRRLASIPRRICPGARPVALRSLLCSHSTSSGPLKSEPMKQKSSLDTPAPEGQVAAEDNSYRAKLSALWKTYGVLAVGTYLGIYGATLSSFFVALDYDLINSSLLGIDHMQAIQKVCDLVETFTGNTSLPGYIRENPRVGVFAVAWIMTKITEPARFAVTLAVVPSLGKLLGKNVPQKQQKQ